MPRQLIIKGHIAHSVNIITDAGEKLCHVLLEGPDGELMADQLKAAGIIVDTNNAGKSFKKARAKYKRKNGEPLHEYAGMPIDNSGGPVRER